MLLPRAFATRIGTRAATWLAWLLAISPLWVLYGRMVRTYVPMALLATGSVLAFETWWRRGDPRSGALAAGLAALAIHLHLGAAAFVLAPFAWAGLVLALRRPTPDRALRELQRLARQGALTAAATGLLLWPARESLLTLRELHGAGAWPALGTWLEVVRLHAGSAAWPVVLAVGLLGLRGFLRLWRSERDFALLAVVLLVVHLLGLAVASPHLLHELLVANRYLLVWLPVGLAFVAVGLAGPWPGLARSASPWPSRALAGALLLGLFAAGPLARERFRTSSFVHAPSSLTFAAPPDRVASEALPAFYRRIAGEAERADLVEVPWMNVASHAFDAYQRVHRHPLRVASLNRLHADPRLALRNTLPFEPGRFLDSGARYVVVHTDLRAEEARVETSKMLFWERLEGSPALWSALRSGGLRMAERLADAWGAPVYADGAIRVWDLARVRRESSLIPRSRKLRVAASRLHEQ